ncbi:hypothetical protein BJL95_06885 [Methylomonas sp. LWB]|uniref:HEPN domain-containing protein n=1 Tax=Methylomonas sp. LWB TaxID=1905845 RepID=UPI0008DA209B|nr:HEPN domain-containing protein [Methylomonas sp. LWB]OHX38000.1 hypothetical protein BJL95_06885 [Methylomonas sp. LWB]
MSWDDIAGVASLDTVFWAFSDSLDEHFIEQNKFDFDFFTSTWIEKINSKLHKYRFYFSVHGLMLKDSLHEEFGEVSIVLFDKALADRLLDENKSNNYQWTEYLHSTLYKKFIGKTTLIVSVFGCRDLSELVAREKANSVISYFRFIFCVLHHDRVKEGLVKISIENEWPENNSDFFYVESDHISLSNHRGAAPLFAFDIYSRNFSDIKKNGYLNEISDFIFHPYNNYEKAVKSAIYWIGEAQNDFKPDSAFVKYWISIESLLTTGLHSQNGITRNLVDGMPILIWYCGHEFSDRPNVRWLSKRINALYDLRSKIVHEGHGVQINCNDLRDLCKYSSWLILSFLWLRSNFNYTECKQVIKLIENLKVSEFSEDFETRTRSLLLAAQAP